MSQKAFGLDIGGTTMKLVSLNPSGEGYVLEAAAVSPTPEKGMLSESPLDQEAMAQSIAALVAEAKVSSKIVNIALPENQVYTRVLDMPVLSESELASAIYWEAEQYIPVPLPSVTLDWKILHQPKAGEPNTKMQVLLVGAPTALINKYQHVMALAGLSIQNVETEITAVIRALIFGEGLPNTLIVHIGAIGTLLSIIKEGMVIFTYFIPVGGIAITRAIASDFGFTASQAEEYKRVYGYSSKTFEGKIGKASEPILLSVLSEVKKALAFYAEKYKSETPITQILLSGGTAKLPGIGIFFAQNAGIEAAMGNPWKVLASQEVPKEILDSAPDYTIAVGLAMKHE